MEKIDDMFFFLYTSAGHVRTWWLTQSRRKNQSLVQLNYFKKWLD
jgi:hypothetical protein